MVASTLDWWKCHLLCISVKSNIPPVTVITKLSHSHGGSDNTVKTHIYCTQNIYMMIIRACAIFSLLNNICVVTSNARASFLSSVFYLPIYIQPVCLIIIDNASTHSVSFNYSRNMHRSPQRAFQTFHFSHSPFFIFFQCIVVMRWSFLLYQESKLILWVI